MEHFYQNLEGMFSFPQLYSYMVTHFNGEKIKFVEIGAYKGKSACFMAVEIINSGKNIEFYAVDHWSADEFIGSPEDTTIKEYYNLVGEDKLYNDYITNIEPVKHVINSVRKNSVEAAEIFENESFDFIFLDASHDYENVKVDLQAWFPKLKKGGIFAGHDYIETSAGVKPAVDEFFGLDRVKLTSDGCFYILT